MMSDIKRAIGEAVKKSGSGGSPFSALSASECSTAAAAAATLHPFGNIDKDGRGEGSNGAHGGSGTGPGKKIPTVRLELNLFEPTADSFPEFNFSKLIHEEQKRRKKLQKKQTDRTGNGFLSDPDMDMDVERMAKELERKYGMGSDYASKGKAARPSKLDYYDRGAGYDEEDSFIDNSEAYDELIPQEVETVGGGFYINSGQLEFKQLSNFERPEDAQRMPKPKKRALSTTSESSDDEEPSSGDKKKPTQSTAPAQQAQKQTVEKSSTAADNQQPNRPPSRDNDKGSMAPSEPIANAPEDEKSRLNGHVAKKQKMVVDNGTVAEPKSKPPASESGKEKTNGVKGKSAGVFSSATATTTATNVQGVTPTAAPVESSKKDENGGMKELKTTTVKDMLRAKRDSLRKMEQEKKGRSSGSSRVSSSEAEEDGDGGGDEDEDEENGEGDDEDEEEEEEDDEYDEEEEKGGGGGGGSDKNSRESVSEVDIVSESESSHENEKDNAAAARGKVTNGTFEAASMPTAGQQQPPKERKPKDCKLPDDISDQLRADVESLKELSRALSASNGKLNFFESKVADLLLRIDEGARAGTGSSVRNAVFRHLESQLSISRQSLQLKLKKLRIRKLETKTKSVLSKLEDVVSYTMPVLVTKYELDCAKVNEMRAAQAVANTLPNGEKADGQSNAATPQIRNPKKKYAWNERSRSLLWELYGIRQQAFELARSRNQTEDEVVAEFIRTKVVPLWPKGWIRYEDIHKELDRRKKALAKSQAAGSASVQSAVGKKSTTTTIVSPLVSPGTTIDAALLPGTNMNGVKAPDGYTPVRSSTPSSVKSTNSKGGLDAEKVGSVGSNSTTTTTTTTITSNHTPTAQSGVSGASSISPNSSFKRTSDHSIINIMNSPPPPPAAAAGDQSAVAFANPDGKRSPATLATHPSPADRKHPLPSPDRQRWNSREDDSDSSIEIIAEYNVPRAAAAQTTASPLPFSSPMLHTSPTQPGATSNLPILNKEKYKNLTVGRNKAHGGSGSSTGSSPISMGETVLPAMGGGKYPKHSTGGVIGFAAPSGNVSGLDMMGSSSGGGGGGAGSVRQKDTPPSIDVDVHQIMKDLKEYQKQHNVGGSRKSDGAALQSQPQHVTTTATTMAATTASSSTTVTAAASSNVVADYFIDCDMDDDDILFATNYTYTGGHKN